MQGSRIAWITGVCVGGVAIVLVAVALGAKRKARTDVYAYSAPGDPTADTTAAFTVFAHPHSRVLSEPMSGTHAAGARPGDLSCSGMLSPTGVSHVSTPHSSPQSPPAYFGIDSPRAGRSAAGGNNSPQTIAVGATGAASTPEAPTSRITSGQRLTAVGEDSTGTVALDTHELEQGNPFPGIHEASTL